MPKLLLSLMTFLALTLPGSTLQAQDKIMVFGAYSYLRPSLTQTWAFVCPPGPDCHVVNRPTDVNTKPSLRGWQFSGTYRVSPWLGVTADFSGHNGTAQAGSSANYHTYLFGPEVRWPRGVSPFAHILIGGADESTSSVSASRYHNNILLGSSGVAFALALGGGVDIKVASFVSLRLIQVDYLKTWFVSNTQNQPRVSAGLVLRF